MRGRFSRSRSPPAPKTTMIRFEVSGRSDCSTDFSAWSVCAKSTSTLHPFGQGTGSSRPGTGGTFSRPSRMQLRSRPSASVTAAAPRAL